MVGHKNAMMWFQKANATFVHLYCVQKAREISTDTKFNVFRSNIKFIIFYGCETWNVTHKIITNLQLFTKRSLT